ncbi:MAG: hypothetical protein NW224_05715 [Leptolyngbyaceae cyanobacterium bins.302]|nr:hypothetical protein [Leptolyngbyaceae cyanobacterium bins.302]
MDETALSQNGVAIRLPEERWTHIIDRHSVLIDKKQLVLDTITQPERILAGNEGALMAVREFEPGRWLVVVYREEVDDGFIITAFPTRRIHSLNRRQQLCP